MEFAVGEEGGALGPILKSEMPDETDEVGAHELGLAFAFAFAKCRCFSMLLKSPIVNLCNDGGGVAALAL